jgi:hypothetical protein
MVGSSPFASSKIKLFDAATFILPDGLNPTEVIRGIFTCGLSISA